MIESAATQIFRYARCEAAQMLNCRGLNPTRLTLLTPNKGRRRESDDDLLAGTSRTMTDRRGDECSRREGVLQNCYEQRKYATEKFATHQKANFESMLDYEMQDAKSFYDEGAAVTKERLLATLTRKRRKLCLAKEKLEEAAKKKKVPPKKKKELPEKTLRVGIELSPSEIRDDLREITRAIAAAKPPESKPPDLQPGDTVHISSALGSDTDGVVCSVDDAVLNISVDDRNFHIRKHQLDRLTLRKESN